MSKKIPLSKVLYSQFPHRTKEEVLSAILCGDISSEGESFKDPKQMVNSDRKFIWKNAKTFVSRGGQKLAGLLDSYQLELINKTVLDAGCSTGGFTDFLLQAGAKRIYAVDVGYNQLDYRLRNNPQVIVMERTNIMDVDKLDPLPNIAVCDLSFRSVNQAASKILSLTKDNLLLALVKPQFERKYYRQELDDHEENPGFSEGKFDGIILDSDEIKEILFDLGRRLGDDQVLVKAVFPSKIRGSKGNQEYFFILQKNLIDTNLTRSNIEMISTLFP